MGIFKRKDSPNYYIRFKHNGKIKKFSVRANNRSLAEKILNKKKTEVAENKFLDVKKDGKIKFKDFVPIYLEKHSKINKKSYRDDVTRGNKLIETFGDKSLCNINQSLVEDYKAKRIKEVKPATVNREVALLKNIFTKAIEWNEISYNPIQKVKFFRENNHRIRFLTQDEVRTLLNVCDELRLDLLKDIVVIALNTGMRRGEILGYNSIKWENIDLDRGIIYLPESKGQRKEGQQKEIEKVYLNSIVVDILKNRKRNNNNPYVFYRDNGKPCTFSSIRKQWEKVLEKANIQNFRFHDLRHTFASHLVMSGIDLKTVQELLRHKTIEMTLRYAHLSPDHKKMALEILGTKMIKSGVPISVPVEKLDVNKETEKYKNIVDNTLVKRNGGVAQLVRAAES